MKTLTFLVLSCIICGVLSQKANPYQTNKQYYDGVNLAPYYESDFDHVSGNGASNTYYNSYANLGPGVSKQVYWKYVIPGQATTTGQYTDATNWWGNFAPRTIDNVYIDSDQRVVVQLDEDRIARSLFLSLGNVLQVDGHLVLATNAPPCSEGYFVDPSDITCKWCDGLGVQNLADQSHCNNCGQFSQIPDLPDRTGCVYCPVGYVFGDCFDITCDEETACEACPAFTSSDGQGGACTCCPAGSSSNGGDACFTCPPGTDSHTCGPCLPCLPHLRDVSCPSVNGNACDDNGFCNAAAIDVFGVLRQTCSCSSGFRGQNCRIGGEEDDWMVNRLLANSELDITLPFPWYNWEQVYAGEECVEGESVSVAVGPTFSFPAGLVQLNLNAFLGIRNLPTSKDNAGYINPYVYPPADQPDAVATVFGWDLEAWVTGNTPLQSNITGPFWIGIPYDRISPPVVNPLALHTWYYNVAESKWVDTRYHCTDYEGPIVYIDNQAGIVWMAAFELSAQYQVFLHQDENHWPELYVPYEGQASAPTFYGFNRPPTATTGIYVAPVSNVVDPGQAAVSAVQNLEAYVFSSASTLMVNLTILLGMLIFLL